MFLFVLYFFLFVTISKQPSQHDIKMRKLDLNIGLTNFTINLNVYLVFVFNGTEYDFHTIHITKLEFSSIKSELIVEFTRDELGHEKRLIDIKCKILDNSNQIVIHKCTVSPKDQIIYKEWIYSFGHKFIFKKNVKYVLEKHHNHFQINGRGRDAYLLLNVNKMTIQSHCTDMLCVWKKPKYKLQYGSIDSEYVIAPCESDRPGYSSLEILCKFSSILYIIKYYLYFFIRQPTCWIPLVGLIILFVAPSIGYL
ncbi:hypothetical protein RF11_13562 [Thelohanellus kitauei]|uniref:Uncharacterized protein n=1 Tax=Thelohanellus kitauei TaxID=669202 RepID=A0A0C2N7X9_THEKT|nr:hypothetical protein RF11_13562 [Thelohanellus kitauei]